MPKRRPARQHYDVDATITPETGLKVSITQMFVIAGGICVAAMAYAYLVWGQNATSKDVADIKLEQARVVAKTADVISEQDKKRDELGKKFLESNEKIANSITQLTTLTAVQQERQKATDEKLEKVLTQIGSALTAPAPAGRR